MAVALRFWARRIQNCSFELNDYLILPALVLKLSEFKFQVSYDVKACALANVILFTGKFLLEFNDNFGATKFTETF